MNDIFGVPVTGIMVTLLIALGICLLTVAWVAWRRPVIFKLGVRNIPRRKAQTILIVVGLMLSTMIISAALGTGDTVDYSMTSDAYNKLGHVDEIVVGSSSSDGSADLATDEEFPAARLAEVEAAVPGMAEVDGVMPILNAPLAVTNAAAGQAEPFAVAAGLDSSRLEAFGGLIATNGATIDLAEIGPNAVVLSDSLADDLDAAAGDVVTLYWDDTPFEKTVAAIAKDTVLSGTTGLTLPLANLQALTGKTDLISAIAISNAGGVRDSLGSSDAVVDGLEAALAGTGLGVGPIKQDAVDEAKKTSTLFTAIFLILGLFSVAAGILLIVLIFTMLAAERRAEMGMARAVGAQRGQLVQQFVSEGSGYALLAGLVGSALGVAATVGIALGIKAIFGKYVPIEPHVSLRSVVVAYCLGVVITFLSVVGSSWKISRLNIVAAVRDLPDVTSPVRRKRTLVWGILLLVFGGLLTFMGVGSDKLIFFATGMSLLPFGIALILRFFGAPSRLIFTIVSLALLVFWLLPQNTFDAIFGEYDGGFEMFFISGIFMVIAATILIVINLDVLLEGVNRLGSLFRGQLPAIRTAIAYPGATKTRTGLTIAMFSLIVFSLVMMATMNKNFTNLLLGDEANAGWDVRADAMSADPVPDFTGTLQAKGVDTSEFTATGVVHAPSMGLSGLRQVGDDDQAWKEYMVRGMDDAFIDASTLEFGQRAVGYESDAAIVEALRSQPDVAVIDVNAVPDGDIGEDADAFFLQGISGDDKTFDPIKVELVDPRDGAAHTVTVIGVIDDKIGSLYGLYANDRTVGGIFGEPATTSYYVALANSDDADAVAKSIESALLTSGVQGISIADELEENQRQQSGFLYIIEGFMGLGLVVGIAAVGVIAFRSVVERRQQIGVLRAIGFQRTAVATSFLIETTFLVGLGGFAGTVLGLVLARNLFTSDDVGSSEATFIIPWGLLAVIIILTNAAALVTTWIPARQAGRIAPAEALRYE
jgi:putative ABC transport system permease protein